MRASSDSGAASVAGGVGSTASEDGRACVTPMTYEELRKHLEALKSEDVMDIQAIDETIKRLAQAQLAAKAANGLIGNCSLE